MKKITGHPWLDDILCSATSAPVVDIAEHEIAVLMRERHHIRPEADDDFNLRHPTEIAEVVKQSTQTMEALLAAVASVSLLVGGIGIMNIMLVSVTERTREIGLRQAVGARGRDVLRQFLIEAVMLSLIGGALGIALGTLGARVIADQFQWPTRVSPTAVAFAFGCSAAVGVFFGYYPARRAANLDPIEALGRIEASAPIVSMVGRGSCLIDPASVFRELTEDRRPGLWAAAPALLLTLCSVASCRCMSGRFTVRLIADGMIRSRSFRPPALALEPSSGGAAGMPFARAVDMFSSRTRRGCCG